MTSDKLTKQEIREDRVVTAATDAVHYVQQNIRIVAAVVGVVVVGVVAVVFITQNRAKDRQEASASLGQAQMAYFQGNYDAALPIFQSVAQKYGSSPAGRVARLFEGNCQLAMANGAAAEQTFRKLAGSVGADAVLSAAAARGLGAGLAAQGKHAEASESYAKAAAVPGDPEAAEDWLRAARAAEVAGKRDEALRAYQQVVENFQGASCYSEAKLRQALLSAR